ncbi:sugar kinase [Nocardioides sp. NBC_00850]|uniref:sugar kinase n=1 Tax=Nocardioides sp. NBC_00850 TaxID=2976001 RepID=UPI00386D9DEF|nr:sugar kinase [Nocardioides sp. NBC_00850]
MSRPAHVVTLGETMGLIELETSAPMTTSIGQSLRFGGAESNVAIGLSRLGVRCTWLSRLGDDALGEYVEGQLTSEGVVVRAARDPQAPTGLMLKEMNGGRPVRVRYYRSSSAASRLSVADMAEAGNRAAIETADVLHVSGITAALGPGPAATLARAIELARASGTTVSFDVNHRASLWSDEQAAPALARLVAAADLVFAGQEEAALVLGTVAGEASFERAEELARELRSLGPATVVIKLGALGALAVTGDAVHRAPTVPVDPIDPVGAGDAFVAGYLAELVSGRQEVERLATANRTGAEVCLERGDWEGLPTRATLAGPLRPPRAMAAAAGRAEVVR